MDKEQVAGDLQPTGTTKVQRDKEIRMTTFATQFLS